MNDSFDDDPRILQVAREYLADVEAGRRPDRRKYTQRYPEIASAISECIDGIEMAQSLRPTTELPAQDSDLSSQPLGDFRIIREIGRGGMGTVYEAIQLSLGRRVALKVLPFAASLDAKQLQRFKTESQAAAQLHHTNIVPVFAVGVDRGVHYYAMQLIEGRTLDQVITELRGDLNETVDLRGTTTIKTNHTRETFRKVATIGAQVADALNYAHDVGVIHRDIKPANLILDDRNNVWVTDFGLAQVSSDVRVTQTGDIFGTLRYMSPEQAQGRTTLIDHRADIYSLGATLYEMLALKPIFNGEDRATLLKQILHDEPRTLRQHDRSIPVELETIVMKSVAKNPGDRYATAGELAEDLRRFLDERPILAKPPSLWERSLKWTRRHPSVTIATVVILILGLIGTTIAAAQIAREQGLTNQALEKEKIRTRQAEERFLLAKRSVDEMIQIAEEELTGPQHETTRRRILESALEYYQEFINERQDDPQAQAELAATRDRVQQILSDLATLQGIGQLFLAFDPSVHDELKCTEAQRQQLREIQSSISDRKDVLVGFPTLNRVQRQQKYVEQIRRYEEMLEAILSTAQWKRLEQIFLQLRGPMAFRDSKVVAALQLTAEQREKMRMLEVEAYLPKGEWMRKGPHGFADPSMAKDKEGPKDPGGRRSDPNHRMNLDSMLAILTAEQKDKWKDLVGEPFSRPNSARFPKFGPRN